VENEERDVSATRVTRETGIILGIVVLVFCGGMPWLLERWTIEKVHSVHRRCGDVLEALLSYRLDRGELPHSLNSVTLQAITGKSAVTVQGEEYWMFLTTPRAYLSEVPKSPFRAKSESALDYLAAFCQQASATNVVAVISPGPGGVPETSLPFPPLILWEKTEKGLVACRDLWYTPSNGLFSSGWIYRDSRGIVSPGG